ncbi:MAG: hypothetical protein H0T73_17320, partial [Ardenticatenales bacterium]|nr:hypothetical protein [Ardenticatenales bacterium]
LEGVLDAYLKQDEPNWAQFLKMGKIHGTLFQAATVAYESFRGRYADELKWDLSQFQQKVAKGTFPLHPLTTALLCNLQLRNDEGDARTLLGFISQEMKDKAEELALADDLPNWILPTRLVDYFERRLDREKYAAYENARNTAGSDAPSEEQNILKALFLQEARKLTLRASDQIGWLAQAAGLSQKATEAALRNLKSKRSLYRDAREQYNFWPGTTNPLLLEQLVMEKLDKSPIDWSASPNPLHQYFARDNQLKGLSLSVDWGHSEDWTVAEHIVTKSDFSTATLRALLPWYQISGKMQEAPRGALLWLVAKDEEELAWYREHAASILDDAFPEPHTPPIVAVLPNHPHGELFDNYVRREALGRLTNDERERVGREFFQTEVNTTTSTVNGQFNELRGDRANWAGLPRSPALLTTTAHYRATLAATPQHTLKNVLNALYGVAYPFHPPSFYTTYPASRKNKLRDATRKVALTLFNPTHRLTDAVRGDSMATDLCDKFLVKEWQLLTAGPTYSVRSEPAMRNTLEAWNYLNECFSAEAGEVNIARALEPLFNAPYGYDYNTLALLFSAWFGYHSQELQIIRKGSIVPARSLEDGTVYGMGGKDFYQNLYNQHFALRRREAEAVKAEARALLDKVQGVRKLTPQQAQGWLEKLDRLCNDSALSAELSSQIQEAHKTLENELHLATEYNRQAREIQQRTEQAKTIDILLEQLKRLDTLPRVGRVEVETVTLAALRERIQERVTTVTHARVEELQQLSDLAHLQLNESELDKLSSLLRSAERSDLDTVIEQGRAQLRVNAERLRQLQAEQGVRFQLDRMDPHARLEQLHRYESELAALTGLSPEVTALRDAKDKAIQASISQAEEKARALVAKAQSISTQAEIDSWLKEANRSLNEYKGTEWYDTLEQAITQVTRYNSYLGELNRLKNQPFSTPEQAKALMQQIQEGYQAAGFEEGSPPHHAYEQARQDVQRRYADQEKKAQEQLQRIGAQIANANDHELGRYKHQLESPPGFLPETSRSDWLALRRQVQARLDANLVAQIEGLFQQITDHKEREACLKRLQALQENTPNR